MEDDTPAVRPCQRCEIATKTLRQQVADLEGRIRDLEAKLCQYRTLVAEIAMTTD